MTDLHIHTHFSSDCDERMENYLIKASDDGDKLIGFSDHCDYDLILEGQDYPMLDFDGWFREVEKISRDFPNIKVLRGIELGYADGAVEFYKELMRSRPFDYSIISVHTVEGRGDCYFPAFFDGLNKHEAYELYLNAVLKSVTSVDFQILGHLGYVARYAPYEDKALRYAEFAPTIDLILRAVIDRNAALELNTRAAGMENGVVTSLDIINRYIELGGKNFTYGSDSHGVRFYNTQKDRVQKLLSGLGVTHTVHYENRKPVIDKL